METKKEIRNRIRQVRADLSSNLRERYSIEIQNKLLRETVFQRADTVFCYVDCKNEVQTEHIIQEAWKQGKKLAVPKVIAKGEMEFFYIQSRNELKVGQYDILEPTTSVRAHTECDLMVLPGICFDLSGNRIGYGGGYYDRYLTKHCPKYKVALAFSSQIVDGIPRKDHDVCVDMILTEREKIRC